MTQQTSTPMNDSPEQLVADANQLLAELKSTGKAELTQFLNAIDTVNRELQQATVELDDIIAEMRAATADAGQPGQEDIKAILDEIEADEDAQIEQAIAENGALARIHSE